jgi:PIN domain nuclease of toxin-antitoxin system
MTLLLDTHAFIWWCNGDERLSDHARSAIADPANTVTVSAISAWEITIKAGAGRLKLPEAPDAYLRSRLRDNAFVPVAFTLEHALRLASVPPLHADPFDRALIAQALVEELTLVAVDANVRRYDVETLW